MTHGELEGWYKLMYEISLELDGCVNRHDIENIYQRYLMALNQIYWPNMMGYSDYIGSKERFRKCCDRKIRELNPTIFTEAFNLFKKLKRSISKKPLLLEDKRLIQSCVLSEKDLQK